MYDDGRYYAENGIVWKAPTRTATGLTLGFPVCTPHEAIGPRGAEAIAERLNVGEKALEQGENDEH